MFYFIYFFKDFIEKAKKIHGNDYDYSESYYINANTPIKIICNKCHHIFYQTPQNHLSKKGCKYCNQSKNEKYIATLLNNANLLYYTQYKFKDCKDKHLLPFDFYLPTFKLCIEYQGEQHYNWNKFLFRYKNKLDAFTHFELQKRHDQIKRDFCKNNNITLIEIKYNENIEEKLKEYLNI